LNAQQFATARADPYLMRVNVALGGRVKLPPRCRRAASAHRQIVEGEMHWPMLRPFGRRSGVAVGDNDPFTALRREMDRLFDSFGRDVGWPAEGSRAAAMTPSIDVSESEGELKIDVDLPGVEEKDVDVAISDNVLTIKGEKKAEREEKKKDFHLVERSYGSFSRSLTLPPSTPTRPRRRSRTACCRSACRSRPKFRPRRRRSRSALSESAHPRARVYQHRGSAPADRSASCPIRLLRRDEGGGLVRGHSRRDRPRPDTRNPASLSYLHGR
jgi:HSP20 family protein